MASGMLGLAAGAARLLVLCALMSLAVVKADRGMSPGGLRDRSVSDPEVRKAAAFAVAAYNQASNSPYYSRALELLEAQSQVLEGITYNLKILLVNTRCEKRSKQGLTQVDLERCALPPKSEQQKQWCKFSVWSRPWLNDIHLTSMSCTHSSS